MGIRSLTVIEDERGKEIVVMYRHFDGYPEGHGVELARFLFSAEYNDMNYLAASVVANFKNGPCSYQFYLYPGGTRGLGEDYLYTFGEAELSPRTDERKLPGKRGLSLRCESIHPSEIVANGTPAEFLWRYGEPEDIEMIGQADANKWKVCGMCGSTINAWPHGRNHFNKHHPYVTNPYEKTVR